MHNPPVCRGEGIGLGWPKASSRRPGPRTAPVPARRDWSGRLVVVRLQGRTIDRPRTRRWHAPEGDAAVPVCTWCPQPCVCWARMGGAARHVGHTVAPRLAQCRSRRSGGWDLGPVGGWGRSVSPPPPPLLSVSRYCGWVGGGRSHLSSASLKQAQHVVPERGPWGGRVRVR